MTQPRSGDFFFPSDLPRGVIGRWARESQVPASGVGSAGATEIGVLRVDNIPIRPGYTIVVVCPRINILPSTGGVVGRVRLRISTSGVATTTSPQEITTTRERQDETAQTDIKPLIGFFTPSTVGVLSIIQTLQRVSASGTCGIFGSTADPNDIWIAEMSGAPIASGVNL